MPLATRDGSRLAVSKATFAAGLQPVWVTAGAACKLRGTVHPERRGKRLAVAACAPSAGRLTVTLTRGNRRVGRRSVAATEGGIVTVTFPRPRGAGPLRAHVRWRAAT